jgi:hypothetical protein
MAQATRDSSRVASKIHGRDPAVYPTPIGYTSIRPAGFPPIDRARLMRAAHAIARQFRAGFCHLRGSPLLRPRRRLGSGQGGSHIPVAPRPGGAHPTHSSPDRSQPPRHAALRVVAVGLLITPNVPNLRGKS